MSVMATTRINGLRDDAGEDSAPAAFEQRILAVEFRSPDGRYWNAIGGGATVGAAIIDARESCPGDATWNAVSWNDLYGE